MAYIPAKDIKGTLHRHSDKTASYTLTPSDTGRIITNQGATGPITITVPAITSMVDGFWCRIALAEYQLVTVAFTSGQLITIGTTGSSQVTASNVGAQFEIRAHPASGNYFGLPLYGSWSAS